MAVGPCPLVTNLANVTAATPGGLQGVDVERVSSLPVTSAMMFNGGVGKRLLNVEEAAGYLGLKVDTVYKKARLRELPFVKVGRALRFDKQALDRLIEQHTIKTID